MFFKNHWQITGIHRAGLCLVRASMWSLETNHICLGQCLESHQMWHPALGGINYMTNNVTQIFGRSCIRLCCLVLDKLLLLCFLKQITLVSSRDPVFPFFESRWF